MARLAATSFERLRIAVWFLPGCIATYFGGQHGTQEQEDSPGRLQTPTRPVGLGHAVDEDSLADDLARLPNSISTTVSFQAAYR